MITPFDENSLKLVSKLNVDIIKIASFDLGNIPFINLISKQKKIVAISTGGGNSKEIDVSLKVLAKNKVKTILLHCGHSVKYSGAGCFFFKLPTIVDSFLEQSLQFVLTLNLILFFLNLVL